MRKLSLALSLALGLAAIAALHAQAPAPAQGNGSQVTVTGCLERAVRNPALDTGNTVGTSGSTAASTATDEPMLRSDTKWVLTSPSKKNAGDAVGTSGRAPKLEYRLDVADESDIAAHEGHTVEITGTVEKGQAAKADSKDAKSRSSRGVPLLKIESVKMIAGDCSR